MGHLSGKYYYPCGTGIFIVFNAFVKFAHIVQSVRKFIVAFKNNDLQTVFSCNLFRNSQIKAFKAKDNLIRNTNEGG